MLILIKSLILSAYFYDPLDEDLFSNKVRYEENIDFGLYYIDQDNFICA